MERSDIKEVDEKGFYGIAPNKIVGLKYAQTVLVKEVIVENGQITKVIAELDKKVTIFLVRKAKPCLISTGSRLKKLLIAKSGTMDFFLTSKDLEKPMTILLTSTPSPSKYSKKSKFTKTYYKA